jgi:sugar lactone lactonase YvrE
MAPCFSPDGRIAYFADSPTRTIRRAPIDPGGGLPTGPWSDFAVCPAPHQPDGAVVDAKGFLWSAQWDGAAVVRHAPDGSVDRVVQLPVSRPTCPVFGGDDLSTLYVTSSRDQLTGEQLLREPLAGGTFCMRVDVPGAPETLVRL